ncbi:hypothetical protein GIB67_003937 [Kingdonia uniflora]|uniref:Glycerol-3-phosphate acyltransferase RAM2/GPAT1-8 HAD-like domain-containing protein n=1 Tax=Kingdonia uniflora TaxID=39325 RepID=A0A7J7ME00_9MAGN|nr:hypothetical protein GIB67_003937 [Kingdonia uniflora]
MDGTLLRGTSSFPYYMLMAFEVGGILRLLFLLLATPLGTFLFYFVSESVGVQVFIFATFSGMKVSDIEFMAQAVLPKFYVTDLHPESWRVFSSCGKKCVLTANPRIMVEAFWKDYLGADMVLGTEIGTYKGRATGFVLPPGVLESYVVPAKPKVEAVSRDILPKALIFNNDDVRLVEKQSLLMALMTICFPIGFVLKYLRIAFWAPIFLRQKLNKSIRRRKPLTASLSYECTHFYDEG